MRYESEFMDENPLQGEPGSFVFSSTSERVKAQHAAAAATQSTTSFGSTQQGASQKTGGSIEGVPKDGDAKGTGSSDNTPTPTPTERKGSAGPTGKEKKRRKSKAAVSPT
jgi:mediator of RNA polymerase II transcription subunit 6